MLAAEADAELGEMHLDGFAVPPLRRGLGFGKSLRLVGRRHRPETIFRGLVRR